MLIALSYSLILPTFIPTAVSLQDILSLVWVMISSILGCPVWFFPRVYFCVAATRSCLLFILDLQKFLTAIFLQNSFQK